MRLKTEYCNDCIIGSSPVPGTRGSLVFTRVSEIKEEKCDSNFVALFYENKMTEIEKDTALKYRVNVFNANGDLKKRWFVYYYKEGKRIRSYGQVNYEKTAIRRTRLLLQHKRDILRTLINGTIATSDSPAIGTLFEAVLKDKKKYLKKRSYDTYKNRTEHFLQWLKYCDYYNNPIKYFTKQNVQDFKMSLLEKGHKNRTANGILEYVSTSFTYIMKSYDGVIEKNPALFVTKLPSRSEKNVAYTEQELDKIKEKLKKADPSLLLFCQFIIYAFMRPAEIQLLRVGDIDTINWTITIPAENTKVNERKRKRLPEIFKKELLKLNLAKYKANDYLFSKNRKPGVTQIGRDHFTTRFKKIKKELGFSKLHTMYGLRHTFICQLKRNGANDRDIMALTGHSSQDSFYKYLRDIGALETKDLSDYYSNPL